MLSLLASSNAPYAAVVRCTASFVRCVALRARHMRLSASARSRCWSLAGSRGLRLAFVSTSSRLVLGQAHRSDTQHAVHTTPGQQPQASARLQWGDALQARQHYRSVFCIRPQKPAQVKKTQPA